MKSKTLIVTAIIAVITLTAILAIAFSKNKPTPPVDPTESTGEDTTVDISSVSDDSLISIPGDETELGDETGTSEAPSTSDETSEYEFDPTDPVCNGDTAPDEINDDPNIKVAESKTEDGDKTPAEVTTPPAEDKTETTEKASTELPENDEIINDTVIEEKEKAEKEAEEKRKNDEDQHPPVVVEEKTVTKQPEEKPAVVDEENDDKPSGNGPTYVDPTKGDHPFVPPVDQDGTVYNSDDLVGDGDKAGEGIHF